MGNIEKYAERALPFIKGRKLFTRRNIISTGTIAVAGAAAATYVAGCIPKFELPKPPAIGCPDKPITPLGTVMEPVAPVKPVLQPAAQQSVETVGQAQERVEQIADGGTKVNINAPTQNPVVGITPCEETKQQVGVLQGQVDAQGNTIVTLGKEKEVVEGENKVLKVDLVDQRNQFGGILGQQQEQCTEDKKTLEEQGREKDVTIERVLQEKDQLSAEFVSLQQADGRQVEALSASRIRLGEVMAERDAAVETVHKLLDLVSRLTKTDELDQTQVLLKAASGHVTDNIIPDLSNIKIDVDNSAGNLNPIQKSLKSVYDTLAKAAQEVKNIRIDGQAIKSISDLVKNLPVIKLFAIEWDKVQVGLPKFDSGLTTFQAVGEILTPIPLKLDGVIGQPKDVNESHPTGLHAVNEILKIGSGAVEGEINLKGLAQVEARRIEEELIKSVKTDKSKVNYN